MKKVIRPTMPSSNLPDYITQWCGPFAMAAVANVPYEEAYKFAQLGEQDRLDEEAKKMGYPPGTWEAEKVEGLALDAMKHGLARMGYHVDWKLAPDPGPRPEYPDLFCYWGLEYDMRARQYHEERNAWYERQTKLRDLKGQWKRNKTYIVASNRHYIVVKNNKVIHTQDDEPVPFEMCGFENHELLGWSEVRRLTP